ncbi:MAG: DUF4173 domain-containing protein [Flavobacteriales bacterium]
MPTHQAKDRPDMMSRHALHRWLPLVGILATAALFDLFFWDRSIGLNLTLFGFWSMGMVVARYGPGDLTMPARLALAGATVALVMLLVHHSTVALVAVVLSLAVFTAFAHERQLRSVVYALPQALCAFVMAPFNAWDGSVLWRPSEQRTGRGWRALRIALIPFLIGVVFFQLYRAGNPRFEEFTAGFLNVLSDLLAELFTPHVFFILLGIWSSAVLIRRQAPRLMADLEQRWTDVLLRHRIRRPHWATPRAMGSLEKERKAGVMLLVLVNLLLLVVNAIDIHWLWFGFEVPEGFSLKQFVHEGTWVLILSILLSIVILLHLFRANLNFYSRAGSLKMLGMLWIAQNFILGISVFLRNYHYIDFHGLAYKRIGVMVFLALMLVGLVTLYIKIRERRSFFYLARVNGWAAFVVLIGLSTVDWDSTIVRYNLGHENAGEIDIDNYLAMSDKVLPLIYADLDMVEKQMERHRTNEVRWVRHLDPGKFREELAVKLDRFKARYDAQHWQEWNLADKRTMDRLLALNVYAR